MSPEDGLKEIIRLTNGGPRVLFEEVIHHLRHSLQNQTTLNWIGFEKDVPSHTIPTQQLYVSQHVSFVLVLAGQRTFAKLKFLTPPWCYSGLTSDNAATVTRTANLMRKDFHMVCNLDDVFGLVF